uniref:Minor glycoprotein n=1 Tax=Kibale red colobus virus 1 TaxID=1885929 RepID=X2D569_9NIDO|nr:minor glycoprotein [Kibale red colobus virus 1]
MQHHPLRLQQQFTCWLFLTFIFICGRCYGSSTNAVSTTSNSAGNSSSSCNMTCLPCHFNYTSYSVHGSRDRDVSAYSLDCATHFLAGKTTEAINITVDYHDIISLLALQMCVARGLALSTTNNSVYFRLQNQTITHLCYAPFTPATHTRSPSPYVLKWGAAITCLLGIAISIK